MAQQQAQAQASQQAALVAQERALRNSQVQAAHQAGTQGSQLAEQQLGLANQKQQAMDASAVAANQAVQNASGTAATGGAYDPNVAKQTAMSNLGAVAGQLPNTQANVAGSNVPAKNPAATTAGSMTPTANNFTVPSLQGIKLGGY